MKNLVFIDGITRSGKFWLANLINHLDAVEHFRHDPSLDYISIISHFNQIKREAAIGLMQDIVNRHIFENAVGRNINFRVADSSSIYKNPNLQEYLMRVARQDMNPDEVLKELQEGDRQFVFIAHDWLSVLDMQLDAFPKMKLIRMERNPVDLVYAWYSTKIGLDRMFFSCRVKGAGVESVPWFAYNWLSKFDEMSDMDRIIKSILFLDDSAKSTYDSLPVEHRSQIHFTSYEMLSDIPAEEAQRIAGFMGVKTTDSVSSFISQSAFRERSIDRIRKARKEKLVKIQENASSELFLMIEKAGREYDEFHNRGGG